MDRGSKDSAGEILWEISRTDSSEVCAVLNVGVGGDDICKQYPTTDDSRFLGNYGDNPPDSLEARSARQMRKNGVVDFTRNSDMLSNRTEMDPDGPEMGLQN